MNTSREFVYMLRSLLDLTGRIVWESHKTGLAKDKEWPESEFFSTMVMQAKLVLQASVKCGRILSDYPDEPRLPLAVAKICSIMRRCMPNYIHNRTIGMASECLM